ncbi:MAG: GNAT family N-acetyltransferase [Ferruginibacter sp.]
MTDTTLISSKFSIVGYEAKYAVAFKALNLAWLDKYALTEEGDLAVLNDPEGMIINTGGVIFLVKNGEEIIGSAALINEGDGKYELAKMAVSESWQGKGISRLLMQKCLDAAKEFNAKIIYLVSNSQLKQRSACMENMGSGMCRWLMLITLLLM